MKRPRRINLTTTALYLNAAALTGILIVLLARDRSPSLLPAAMADPAQQMPIAGGSGVYIMPCQLHPSVWGCYLLDTEHQTLCVYEYRTATPSLVLTAARHFQYDLGLKNMDTFPAWYDIKKETEDAQNAQKPDDGKAPTDVPPPANNP